MEEKLTAINGIGIKRAQKLIKAGVKSLDDLKKFPDLLTTETTVYIKRKPLLKIPHKVIKQHILPIVQSILPNTQTQLVGSFRREKSHSRDVDIMLVSDDLNILEKFRKEFIKVLRDTDYYSTGDDKMSFVSYVSKIPGFPLKNTNIKFDVFRCPKSEYAPMLLYSTGSAQHNIIMRAVAKRKGMLLNQKGLYKDGKRIKTPTEQSIFDALGMKYLEPKQRT